MKEKSYNRFGHGPYGRRKEKRPRTANTGSAASSTQQHQMARNPPSTANSAPVTKDALSERSQTAAAAISSGTPILPTGSLARSCSVKRANLRSDTHTCTLGAAPAARQL